MIIAGRWSYSTQTKAKETLDSVPIEVRFYYRPVVVAIIMLPMQPRALPPPSPPIALQSRLQSPLLSSLQPKWPEPPTSVPTHLCSHLPLPPLRLHSVMGVPVLSMAVKLHWPSIYDGLHPMPGWLRLTLLARAPHRLGSCSPTVPLILLESCGGGGGGVPVEDGAPQWSRPRRYSSRSSSSSMFSPPPPLSPVPWTTACVSPPSLQMGGWFRVFQMTSSAGSLRWSRPASLSPLACCAKHS